MARNLNRLTAAASRQAALNDMLFVYNQLKNAGHQPPLKWHERDGAKKIDRATRYMIVWAQENGIEIQLPDGWT